MNQLNLIGITCLAFAALGIAVVLLMRFLNKAIEEVKTIKKRKHTFIA